jgi:hypothetical protein
MAVTANETRHDELSLCVMEGGVGVLLLEGSCLTKAHNRVTVIGNSTIVDHVGAERWKETTIAHDGRERSSGDAQALG